MNCYPLGTSAYTSVKYEFELSSKSVFNVNVI